MKYYIMTVRIQVAGELDESEVLPLLAKAGLDLQAFRTRLPLNAMATELTISPNQNPKRSMRLGDFLKNLSAKVQP